jgi:hypothetical protein
MYALSTKSSKGLPDEEADTEPVEENRNPDFFHLPQGWHILPFATLQNAVKKRKFSGLTQKIIGADGKK